MAKECLCGGGIGSLHRKKDCKKFLKKAINIMPIQREAGGVKNFIDATTVPIPESVFEAMFLEADAEKRLHIVYDIKNTAYEPQEGTSQEWEDGTSSNLTDGNLQMTFIIPETDIDFIGNAGGLTCKNPDTYLYLKDGSIVGYADRNTIATEQKVYPLPVDKWTIVETPLSTDTAVAQVAVTIDFANIMDYGNWIIIQPSEHEMDETANYEPAGANLVLGATPTTATAIEVVATLDGSGLTGNSVPINGLTAADFALTVNTVTEPILTVTESPTGTYTITYASQGSGDTISASLAPTSGYVAPVVSSLVP